MTFVILVRSVRAFYMYVFLRMDTIAAVARLCLQSRIGQIASQLPSYTVPECRSLVKTLVSGVKTITWGASTCKAPNLDPVFLQNKQFLPRETLVYVRLVHFALRALDIYTINVGPSGQQHVRPAK